MKSAVLLKCHGFLDEPREYYVPPRKNHAFDLALTKDERLLELEDLVLSLYLIDRNYPNETELTIQVRDATVWSQLGKPIEELFLFLTDRKLVLKFEETEMPRTTQKRLFDTNEADGKSVMTCLFSGGLDSTAGVLNLGSNDSLLSHTITGKNVYGKVLALHNHPKISNYGLVLTNNQVSNTIPGTSRLRGLLFLTNASVVACSFGQSKVVLPENGPLMINPQVSLLSAHPSRNAHPLLVRKLEHIIRTLIGKDFSIDCILKEKTKVEAFVSLLNEPDLINKTYSCFTVQGQCKMCGICYACYVRRCSAWCIGFEESARLYAADPFGVDLGELGDVSVQKINILKDSFTFFIRMLQDDEFLFDVLGDVPEDFFKNPVKLLRDFAAEVLLGANRYLRRARPGELNALGRFASETFSRQIDPSMLERRREELQRLVETKQKTSSHAQC